MSEDTEKNTTTNIFVKKTPESNDEEKEKKAKSIKKHLIVMNHPKNRKRSKVLRV